MPSLNHQNCCSGTAGRAIEARLEAEPSPWWLKCCRGRRMEVQWSPQWSLKGRYWSVTGGTVVVQGRQKHRPNWYIMFRTVRIFTGWPKVDPGLCIHYATTAMCVPSSCLLSATDLLGDLCTTVLNTLKTHGVVWTCPVLPLNDQGNLSASWVPSTATCSVLWSNKEGTKATVLV